MMMNNELQYAKERKIPQHKTLSALVIDVDNYTKSFEAVFTIDEVKQTYVCTLYGESKNDYGMRYLHSIIMGKNVIFECLDFDDYGRLLVKIAG